MSPSRGIPAQRGGCRQGNHCGIWYGRDGIIVIGCAHCPQVSKKMDVSETYTATQLDKAVASSRSAHAARCARPCLSLA